MMLHTVLAMFCALNLGSFAVASRTIAPKSSSSRTSSFEKAHTVLDSACICFQSVKIPTDTRMNCPASCPVTLQAMVA